MSQTAVKNQNKIIFIMIYFYLINQILNCCSYNQNTFLLILIANYMNKNSGSNGY